MPEPVPSTLLQDRACIHCGYNLRGLVADGSCPECGRPIAGSLRGNFLEHADPQWLDRLRFGCALKLWNIALTGLFVAVAVVLMVLGLPKNALESIVLVGSALGVWASFAITTQEPRISLQEDSVTLRKAIRLCVVASAVGSLLSRVIPAGQLGIVVALLGSGLQLCAPVSFFGELVYLRRFALRVPDVALAKATKTLQWGGAIALALVIIIGSLIPVLVSLFSGTTTTSGGGRIVITSANFGAVGVLFASFACILGLAAAVFAVWYLALLITYRRVFAEAALAARSATA